MIPVQEILSVGRHQASNLSRVFRGLPINTPQLTCMTLDADDLEIASRELVAPQGWNDRAAVHEFEEEFARWNGSATGVAMASGREALTACLHALDLRPGDEVIVPGYTCIVVVNAIRFAGLVPVFADIELETFGVDAEDVERRLSSRTRAVLLHHLYGLVSRDYERLIALARIRGLRVIEDCAHATGAELRGAPVGNLGDVAFYSFEQSKVLNTYMGGMATTNDSVFGARLREFAEAAREPEVAWTESVLRGVHLGYARNKDPHRWWRRDLEVLKNAGKRLESTTVAELRGEKPAWYGRRMSAPVARLGLNQLAKVDGYNAKRRTAAARWDRWCATHGYTPPRVIEESTPVFLRYPVLVEPERKRNRSWALREEGVEVGVWFSSHLHPAPGSVADCPNASTAVARCINFPCLP